MKKLLTIIVLIFAIAISTQAQSTKGIVIAITPDTLTKVETEYFTISAGGSYNSIAITTLFTEIAGTSDGSAILQASVDGISYYVLNETSGVANFYPNDTLSITSGAIWNIVITEPAFKYYRVAATGTASPDITLVTTKYILK